MGCIQLLGGVKVRGKVSEREGNVNTKKKCPGRNQNLNPKIKIKNNCGCIRGCAIWLSHIKLHSFANLSISSDHSMPRLSNKHSIFRKMEGNAETIHEVQDACIKF